MRTIITRSGVVPIDDIKPHPRNVRRGDLNAIADSLEFHGQYRPIVVQESTGFALAGNHTWRAAKERLGWSEIEANYVDVTDDEALRILLIDNRTNDMAGYYDEALSELLEDLADSPAALDGTGYDLEALDELMDSLGGVDDGDERYTPEWLFEAMDVEFDIDLAAPPGGIDYIPAGRFLTKEDDALTHDWTGLFAWANPPYSIAGKFGAKWVAEIKEGVWLGPMSHSTKYRVAMFDSARAVWFPREMEFEYRGQAEGIAFPVFLAGFGPRGETAVRNLVRNQPDAGQPFKRARFRK